MSETRYQTLPQATIITRDAIDAACDLERRLVDEIVLLNDALDIGAEQARRLRHEIDVQTARADLAESKVRFAVGANGKAAARLRTAEARMRALIITADRYSYADGVKIRHCCNTTTDQEHAADCSVRLAEEWLGPKGARE